MPDPITRLNQALEGSGMSRRVLPLIIGPLLLSAGWGCSDDPTDLNLCSDPVAFADANLEAAIRAELGIGAQDDLTCDLLSGVTNLDARSQGIASLMGIENLLSLTTLTLIDHSITDISALSGLTSLTRLNLEENSITDISALSGLTNLCRHWSVERDARGRRYRQ